MFGIYSLSAKMSFAFSLSDGMAAFTSLSFCWASKISPLLLLHGIDLHIYQDHPDDHSNIQYDPNFIDLW